MKSPRRMIKMLKTKEELIRMTLDEIAEYVDLLEANGVNEFEYLEWTDMVLVEVLDEKHIGDEEFGEALKKALQKRIS